MSGRGVKKILVINTGSSTIKANIFAITGDTPTLLAKANADQVGTASAILAVKNEKEKISEVALPGVPVPQVIERIFVELAAAQLCQKEELWAIGHRVVHGGRYYTQPAIIDADVIAAIRELAIFAPLHNAANLAGIEKCRAIAPQVVQVAVFDTAFHQTMPQLSATYAIPRALSEKYGLRRYGFHGTSHEYVMRACARRMEIPLNEFNAISLHLGNGASACAIRQGKSVDTSMGFTPLEGLIMGTRSGDIDPSLPFFLQRVANFSPQGAEELLNKKSGLLGLCGDSDMRTLLHRAEKHDEDAAFARDLFCLRVRKYLTAYLAWGKPHAIIFTGGIGENSPEIRERVLEGLDHLAIYLDKIKNRQPSITGVISQNRGIPIYAIATDEELMIAEQVLAVVRG